METRNVQQKPGFDLFDLTMRNEWKKVADIYKNHPSAHKEKITRSEDTALHIAVSTYRSKLHEPPETEYIRQMINAVDMEALRMPNDRGDTPIHLAATFGWTYVCSLMAEKNKELVAGRNVHNETPLFLAAHHGNLQTFLCLHEMYNERTDRPEPDVSLCRRKDGNTILHSAISGEYFELAYQIIHYYKNLVNSVNVDGETPLHVLARKPNVFKSSIQLRFYDSIIYHSVLVNELKVQKYNPKAAQSESYSTSEADDTKYHPYRTCLGIYSLLKFIVGYILVGFGCLKEQNGRLRDEENQQQGDRVARNKNADRKGEYDDTFPANCATCILLFKFVMKIMLVFLGVGFGRINKLKERKERYSNMLQIMMKMMESESPYRYTSTGQQPDKEVKNFVGVVVDPNSPPPDDEHERDTSHGQMKSDEKMATKVLFTDTPQLLAAKTGLIKSDEKMATKVLFTDTPLLLAAKTGIPELVKALLSKCPMAIHDLNSEGKNVLLLAAQNRQSSVFDYLVEKKRLPEYMFHQLDKERNSILHLASMMEEQPPWRIPGAALQMQWELKWYKHVKNKVPKRSYSYDNAKGETPRKVFKRTHQNLMEEASRWLIKTSESCSVVAALIAGVAYATSATVPGGVDDKKGLPLLNGKLAFDIFSISSLMALCLSVTALVFFLAIITSRCEEKDFKKNLPRKLLFGLSSLFAAIAAMLVSFCAAHTFIMREKLRIAVWPIYAFASIPLAFFAMAQLPLYFDLLWAACVKVPLRSFKVFYQ